MLELIRPTPRALCWTALLWLTGAGILLAGPAAEVLRWAGEMDARPEGLACLDLDRDGTDDAVVVDARGLLLLPPAGTEQPLQRLPWPAEAPVAPAVRDPHARVVALPPRLGGGLAVVPSARGGYGVLREAPASLGTPALAWTLEGTAPLSSRGDHVLTGLRVAGTHQLMGLKLDDAPVRGLPGGVRATALLRGPSDKVLLVVGSPEGVSLHDPADGRAGALLSGVAPPLLAVDDDGDGVDELYSALDTERGTDALMVTRLAQGRPVVERAAETGGRLVALARCPGGPGVVMALVQASGGWRVMEVRP
ncbi:MAG: hypothetical protein AB2A00_28845 [Myxococcota bacterium]